jgi:hypothetical protein
MQVILAVFLVVRPGGTAEHALPVVGHAAVRRRVAPDVVVMVGACGVDALAEPLVLDGGVVYHQVHDDLEAQLMGAVKHAAEDLLVPIVRRDAPVVRNVIAKVGIRRDVQRREPDATHAQRLHVVELLVDAIEVANAVAVAVGKAARPDLVEHHVLVPLVTSHGNLLRSTPHLRRCVGAAQHHVPL